MKKARKKWKGYAKAVAGYGGEVYVLYRDSKRAGTSTFVGTREQHQAELRASGYKIRKGTVKSDLI